MTSIVPLDPAFPRFNPTIVPGLPQLSLTEAERMAITRLQAKGWRQREWMLLTDAYYRGMQVIQSLGIALPPELEGLRIVVGWPKIAVDPYIERLGIDSFRLNNATTADQTLTDVWLANGMESEQSVGFLESLVMGRCYYTIGRGDEPDGPPRICVESPLNIAANWDLRGDEPIEVFQTYWADERWHAVLMLPNTTVTIAQDDKNQWQIVDRDAHNFGAVPVVRQANRPRAADRDGSSEITPELMSITDSASRTLLNLAAAGEFYAVPQKLLLGVTEEDFIAADGSKKTAWETYIGRLLALQRDENGDLPEVKEFRAYDPAVFTKVVEMFAGQAAGIMAATPQDLGLYTQGNPVSAEAWQVAEGRRDRRARRMQANFGVALSKTAKWAIRYLNDGELPPAYNKVAPDWVDPQISNFVGVADGLNKLVTAGIVPAASDVVRKKAGFTAVERAQLARETDDAQQVITEIGSAVESKDIRAANALAGTVKDAQPSVNTPESRPGGGTNPK